jgi:hypothetical protein
MKDNIHFRSLVEITRRRHPRHSSAHPSQIRK